MRISIRFVVRNSLEWAVSLHDMDLSMFLTHAWGERAASYAWIDKLGDGFEDKLIAIYLAEHGWVYPLNQGFSYLKLGSQIRELIRRRINAEVKEEIEKAVKTSPIAAFGPSLKYESDALVHALLDCTYSGPSQVASIWNNAVGGRVMHELEAVGATYNLVEPISPEEVELLAPELAQPYRIVLDDSAFATCMERDIRVRKLKALAVVRTEVAKAAISPAS